MKKTKLLSLFLVFCFIASAVFCNFGVSLPFASVSADGGTQSVIPDGLLSITETVIEIPNLTRQYKLLQVADSHIVVPSADTSSFYYSESITRYNHFTYNIGPGTPSSTIFPYFFRYAEENNVNAVVMTGDNIDFPSSNNISFLSGVFAGTTVPHLYVPGNHDWTYPSQYFTSYARSTYRPMLNSLMNGNTYIQYMDLGEVVVVAIDNSEDYIYYQTIADTIRNVIIPLNKPIIVFLHVPLQVSTLTQSMVDIWGRDISMGPHGTYNANTRYVYEWITGANTNVKAVFAGHLHYNHLDYFPNGVPQYTAEPAYLGNARLITIKRSPCVTHTWDSGNVTVQPTITPGEKIYHCQYCEETYTEILPAIYTLGGINSDSSRDLADLHALRRHLASAAALDEAGMITADVNRDGKVNIKDSLHYRRFLAGLCDISV